ncbi:MULTISPECIES: zinc ribbon domain-containing protein [unclassified Sphingobium]|uniref:zinc ribbon domain-containing protein n=1 Tax=unclassified Sphingobium TaxID=2611147 RepID=UPI0035A61169
MVFVIFWLICGGIAAMIASNKGGSGILGFAVGVLLGPFGIIAAFFMGSQKEVEAKQIASGDSKKCPRCAELVKVDALVCKHCGHEFA